MQKLKKRSLALLMITLILIGVTFCLSVSAEVSEEKNVNSNLSTTESKENSAVLENQEETNPATQETDTQQPAQEETQQPTKPEITVGTVKNIMRTSNATTSISLSWNYAGNADGFNIYWRNADTKKAFSYLTTTTKTTYKKTDLTNSTMYEFKICAYVKDDDNKKIEGAASVFKTTTTPKKVTGLWLEHSSSYIDFSWDKNPNADGYIVYRQCYKTNGSLVKYKALYKNTAYFKDTSVEQGRGYYYRVKAWRRDADGKVILSDISDRLETVCGLCAPVKTGFTTQLSRASMSWRKNKYAQGYDIYYATTNQTKYFKKLSTTTADYENTIRLTNGKKYYFRIIPYRYVGSSTVKAYGTYLPLSVTINKNAYSKSVGNEYVEISIKQQRIWYYKNGDLKVTSKVVTGNYGTNDTPKGYYKIYQKLSPATLVGPGYASRVNYWMAFTYSGCGIHDSSWRSSYGGNIYKGNGSHGCVNTPYGDVKKLYQYTRIGTPVIVY